MNEPPDWSDERLARLIAASRGEADPASLAGALRRLEARETTPAWVAWLARPAALAASCALLVVSVGLSSVLVRGADGTRSSAATTSSADFMSQLLDDDGALPVAVADSPGSETHDSGGGR